MSNTSPIFITVRSGIATVDETTVPAGIEVRILDFDSAEQDAERFDSELDSTDRTYLSARHSTVLLDLKDNLDDDDDDYDDDLDEENDLDEDELVGDYDFDDADQDEDDEDEDE